MVMMNPIDWHSGKKLPGSSWAEPPQQQTPLNIGYSWKSLLGLTQAAAEQVSVVLQARGADTTCIYYFCFHMLLQSLHLLTHAIAAATSAAWLRLLMLQ